MTVWLFRSVNIVDKKKKHKQMKNNSKGKKIISNISNKTNCKIFMETLDNNEKKIICTVERDSSFTVH